jgi:hypothetical protein
MIEPEVKVEIVKGGWQLTMIQQPDMTIHIETETYSGKELEAAIIRMLKLWEETVKHN